MAARRYGISLRMLKIEIFFNTGEEKFRIFKWPCNVLFIIHIPIKCKATSRSL